MTQQPTRVAFFHFGDPWIRGSEETLLQYLEHVDRHVISPVAICNHSIMQKAIEALGVKTYRMYIPEIMINGGSSKLELFSYIKALFRLRSILKKERVDLLYCNSGLPCQVGIPVSRSLRVPLLCHLHVIGGRRCYWIWFVKFASHTIFTSNFVRNYSLSRCRFKHDTSVVYNGVDHEHHFYPITRDPSVRETLGIGKTDVVIGQVGSLIRRKGGDLLIKAFSKICDAEANARLVFVGDGEDRDEFVQLAKETGQSSRIIFTGEVPRKEVRSYMQHVFDINVLASRDEGLPLVVLQGAACQLPSVVMNSSGLKETVVDGETGFLFDVEDVDMLSDRLLALMRDASLRKRMGERAREVVSEKFTVSTYVSGITDRIVRVVDSGRTQREKPPVVGGHSQTLK